MNNWYERWNNALREQHQYLFDQDRKGIKSEFAVEVGCPVCGKTGSRLWFEKDWFRWYRCIHCSMVYMNPRLSNTATYEFYNSKANAIYNESKFDQLTVTSEFDDKANAKNLKLIDLMQNGKKGTLLEIGSGKGYFLKKSQEGGFKVVGLELNQKNCEFSRRLLGPSGMIKDVDLLEAKFDDRTFDVIYMRDLIQHIPNPAEFVRECHRVAKPGCILFIGTHNIDGLIARAVGSRYTPVFGFMEPHHFSPRSLTKLLNDAGFIVKKINFESIDCTLGEILSYQISSTFTTVFPRKVNPLWRMILRLVRIPFLLPPFKYLDAFILPQLSNLFRLGSWMNVIAQNDAT